MTSKKCAIALGSNLGDSPTILKNALQRLNQVPNITIKAYSNWYLTPAVGPPQPDYVNGCALLEVGLTPQELLATMLRIETEFGRVRREYWGPRFLDLDLLLFEDLILATPSLQVPHPYLRQRAFVLVPLAEIAPDWVDPVSKKAIKQLLKEVDCSEIKLL